MTLPTTTRQYQLTEPGSYKNLEIKEALVKQPGAHEALVKVHAVSLQFRDLLVASGNYPAVCVDQVVPCSDMAGEIIAIGEGVDNWKVGDRVCASFCLDHLDGDTTVAIQNTSLGGQSHGVLTQYRTFPTHSLVSIPASLSYEEASTLPCAALTAYNALVGPRPVKAGDSILVLGTGGVSISALQFAAASGATVIATSSSDEKLKIATALGARHVINYSKNPNWDEEVIKLTGGVGVDHVIEVGGQGTLTRSVNAVRVAGQVHVIGAMTQGQAGGDIFIQTIMKGITLRGIQIGSVAQFRDMIRLMIASPEKTKPVIDKVFSFDSALDAYAYMESQKHVGKIVIKVA